MPAHVKNCLIVYSFSKSLSLPGERIGYIAVSPKMDYYEEVKSRTDHNEQNRQRECPIPDAACHQECLNERPQIEIYDQNRKMLYEHLTALALNVWKPQGAFLSFL